jgi:hypothetical protein
LSLTVARNAFSAMSCIWPQASLMIFLLLYFVFLWVAWLLAVKLTEPRPGRQAARSGACDIA